jgi:hypothetical protein
MELIIQTVVALTLMIGCICFSFRTISNAPEWVMSHIVVEKKKRKVSKRRN